MKKRYHSMKSSEIEELAEVQYGELNTLKRMIAAAIRVFWLKRGSRDEGRDL